MKIKPQIYAKTLLEIKPNANLKQISQKFWRLLQKNKQYRELPKILDLLDFEFAQKNGCIFTKVYSSFPLNETEKNTITAQLKNRFKKEVIVQNIIKQGITGIIVKADDKILDLSLESKAKKLKRILG